MNRETSRTWAEINLTALKQNYSYLRSLAPQAKFMGVCKANAYGHHAPLVAKALEEFGAEMLAVATVEEGVELRESGISLPILVLGHSDSPQFPDLITHKLTPTVHNVHQGAQLDAFLRSRWQSIPVHVKVDTGMGRLGFSAWERENTIAEITQLFQGKTLLPQGIYSHFASADVPEKENNTSKQYQELSDIKEALEQQGLHFPLLHSANSAGILNHPHCQGDLIRGGIALYGYSPDGGENPLLTPVLSLYTRVVSLKHMPKGSGIGYGSSHILEKDSLVAVLPVGYADGYGRCYSQGMEVEILGKSCPVLGRVCMDMSMVDVSCLEGEIQLGQQVTLCGASGQMAEATRRGHTISYEILCRISGRVPRIGVEKPSPQ